LTELTAKSGDVYKRLQDLVSSQLANMPRANELNEAQDAKAQKLHAEVAKQSDDKLASLQKQIADTEKQKEEALRSASLSSYNDPKSNITNELGKESYIDLGFGGGHHCHGIPAG